MNSPEQFEGFRLSAQQERYWRLSTTWGNNPFGTYGRVRFDGPLDVERLEHCLLQISARHEALRTRLQTVPGLGLPLQVIDPVPVGLTHIRHCAHGPQEAHVISVETHGRELQEVPRQDRALTVELIVCSTSRHYLCITLGGQGGDARSLHLLLQELLAIYGGVELPPVELQYADYAEWQQEVFETDRSGSRSYWAHQWAPALAQVRLPLARWGTALACIPACQEWSMPAPLSQTLRQQAHSLGVSPACWLLAAWVGLLARHLEQPEVGVSVYHPGRPGAAAEAIGPYEKYLPLRCRLNDAETFAGLVHWLATQLGEHEIWQEYCAWEQAPTSAVGYPLGYAYLPAFAPCLASAVSCVLEYETTVTERHGLQLRCHEQGEGFRIVLHYDTQQCEAGAAQVVLEQLHTLIRGAMAQPEAALLQLPMLSDRERAQVLAFARGTPRQLGAAAPEQLHVWFEHQVTRTPTAVAAVHGQVAWTYAALNRRANQLARALLAQGLAPEECVGLCLRQPLWMLEAMLAVLKAGGTYVPLDPGLPAERLHFIGADAGIRRFLTDAPDDVPCLPAASACVPMATLHAAAGTAAAENPGRPVHPAQLAYVLYTSGSTGQPKGVAVSHANAVYSTQARHAYYTEPVGAFLLLSPFAFDSSVAGIYWTLSQGGTLCLPGADELQDLAALGGMIERHRVTHLLGLPSFYALLLEHIPDTQLHTLRVAIVAGESCAPALARQHQARLPQTQLYNEYGPTEATVWSTAQVVQPLDGDPPVPIGRPIPGNAAYVLDASMDLLPRGVAGELYLGGPGVTRGYLGRTGLTAERFLPDLYGTSALRLYRSGDRVRWGLDGTLEFLGRVDQQVKLRGYRIELGEIEARLVCCPQVREAAVLVREDQPGERRLVAYVVGHIHGLRVEVLQAQLQAVLPEFMLPTAWVELEALPLNANGKLDRARLPAPQSSRRGRASVAPRNARETILVQLWQELLRRETVGIEDNFFELGGDSILSIQMVGRARQHGIVVTARQVFEHQTIAALAAIAGTASPLAVLPRVAYGAVPLTPIQHWFFALGYACPELWTHAMLLRPRQPLVAAALATAVDAVVRHHDALRAQFVPDGPVWRQRILPEAAASAWLHVDLPAQPEAAQAEAIQSLATSYMAIDLATGPLLRVVWFHPPGQDLGQVLVVLHHLVADGLSWRLLLADIQEAYGQALAAQPITLPAQTTALREWAERLQSYAQSPLVQAEVGYWTAPTRHAVLALPVDMPQGERREARSAVLQMALSAAETAALLHDVPPVYRTRLDEVLLTALALTLSRWQETPTVLVDVDRHGREAPFAGVDLSRTMGWFTSVVPTLLHVDPAGALLENLKAVKEQLREPPYQGLHYGLLRYLDQQGATAARLRAMPQAQVIFNYMGQLDPSFADTAALALTDGQIRRGRHPDWLRPYELALNTDVMAGQLRVEWDYSDTRYRRSTIEALAQSFLHTLRYLITACLAPEAGGYTPSDFPLARLNQAQVDHLFGQERGIADVYPLSAVQAGMLFHSLYSPDRGVYVQQISGILEGPLDLAALRAAWQTLVERHSILRTACRWEHVDIPLQVVYQRVELPTEVHDWRQFAPAAQAPRWQEYLAADRQRGFAPAQAPLMRFAVMRLAEERSRFLWTHHHLLLDGWCPPLVFTELFSIYETLQHGAPLPVTPPAPPYRDYIAWLQQQDTAAAERFWRQALAGLTASGTLALPRPAAVPGEAPGEERLVFAATETARLEAFVQQHKVTLNTVVQAAWALLLSQYNGASEVLFGVTVAGRPAELPGIESMLGLCINTLPLRVQLRPQMRVQDWLRALMGQNLDMREYAYAPLAAIQGWSGVPRGQPWFESVVVFENYPLEQALAEAAQPLAMREVRFDERTNYPLTLVGLPGECLQLHLTYDQRRFSAAAMTRLAGHLATLLFQLIDNPEARLVELSCLRPDEQAQLEHWQQPATAAVTVSETLSTRFERQVQQHPQAIALRHGALALSYAELNAQANRLARLLRSHGVGLETRVGLCVTRGFNLIVGLLAILKAGGSYVPLDPTYPAARLQHMIVDAAIALIVTDTVSAQALPEDAGMTLCLERLQESLATQADVDLNLPMVPAASCYVIYTSGSTGRPKGVVVSHRNVLRLFQVTQPAFGFNAQDVWTLCHAYAFDFSVWELWGALLYGGLLVLVPGEVARAPEDLHHLLRREGVTVLNQTPSSFYQLDAADAALGGALALRLVIFGGEALDLSRLHGWLQRHGEAHPRLVNMYGITETTVHVTLQDVGLVQSEAASSLIGRPLADLQIVILDPWGNPVPVGIAGELYVGGGGVSRGYLGQPALTAERFLPNPWAPGRGECLYRTGDLGRYRPDGSIEYLGRIDQQVKIRGFRIELGEIAARLREHPQVQEACVLLREDRPGDQRLVAYVVPRQGRTEATELRAYVQALLPDYMVPGAYVQLAALPLTANGKLDHKSLPTPEYADTGTGQGYVAPAHELEEGVAAVWQQVLGCERVGALDDFFALGGHSLLATQIATRLQTAFAVEMPLAVLFDHPTVRGQAAFLEQALIDQITALDEDDHES